MKSIFLKIIMIAIGSSCFISHAQMSDDYLHDPDDIYKITPYSQQVMLRFYVVARLQRVVKLMEQFTSVYAPNFFEHWSEFKQYKFLTHPTFETQFIKEVFHMLHMIYQGALDRKQIPVNDDYSRDYYLALIDRMYNQVTGDAVANRFFDDFEETVDVDDIMTRFYAIHRLERVFDVLKVASTRYGSYEIDEDEIQQLTHGRVKDVQIHMIEQQSIEPIFILWQDLSEFRYAQDRKFLKELLVMVFTTYKHLMTNYELGTASNQILHNEIMELTDVYEKIDLLTTQELLDAIDHATMVVLNVVQKIENESFLSWTYYVSWLYKPAVAVANYVNNLMQGKKNER